MIYPFSSDQQRRDPLHLRGEIRQELPDLLIRQTEDRACYAHAGNDLVILVVDRHGDAAGADLTFLVIIGISLLADPVQFFEQGVFIGNGMGRERVHAPLLKDVPKILETPNDEEGYAREIRMIREMMTNEAKL